MNITPPKEAIAAASTNQSIQEELVELWLDNEPNQAKLILGAFKIGIKQGEFNTQSAITSSTAPLEQRITQLEDQVSKAFNTLKSNLDRDEDQSDTLNGLVIIAVNSLHWKKKELTTQQKALKDMTEHYVALINSGDTGNWNPEDEDVVKKARAAMGKIT
jgi:hypothetical protein